MNVELKAVKYFGSSAPELPLFSEKIAGKLQNFRGRISRLAQLVDDTARRKLENLKIHGKTELTQLAERRDNMWFQVAKTLDNLPDAQLKMQMWYTNFAAMKSLTASDVYKNIHTISQEKQATGMPFSTRMMGLARSRQLEIIADTLATEIQQNQAYSIKALAQSGDDTDTAWRSLQTLSQRLDVSIEQFTKIRNFKQDRSSTYSCLTRLKQQVEDRIESVRWQVTYDKTYASIQQIVGDYQPPDIFQQDKIITAQENIKTLQGYKNAGEKSAAGKAFTCQYQSIQVFLRQVAESITESSLQNVTKVGVQKLQQALQTIKTFEMLSETDTATAQNILDDRLKALQNQERKQQEEQFSQRLLSTGDTAQVRLLDRKSAIPEMLLAAAREYIDSPPKNWNENINTHVPQLQMLEMPRLVHTPGIEQWKVDAVRELHDIIRHNLRNSHDKLPLFLQDRVWRLVSTTQHNFAYQDPGFMAHVAMAGMNGENPNVVQGSLLHPETQSHTPPLVGLVRQPPVQYTPQIPASIAKVNQMSVHPMRFEGTLGELAKMLGLSPRNVR